jgi:D-galactarolactone isomerase
MSEGKIGRRTFLQGAGLAALGAAEILHLQPSQAQDAVPNSSGTEAPKLKAPAHACDCHHHIYDLRFPPAQPGRRFQANATVVEYRLLQRRTGTSRDVVVLPVSYVTDNRVILDCIAQLGADNSRGIAVLHPTVTDDELDTLNRGGVRGIRFTLGDPSVAATTIDMIEPLSKRVNALGWHVQINMRADQIVAAEDLWNRLPSPIVFDSMGNLPPAMGVTHPAFTVMRKLIDKGRTWVKLTFVGTLTKDGPPTYADVTKVAQAYVKAAPERMVWGSNWPHPGETPKPDDAVLFDLLAQWAPDEATRHHILVENPETLYGFAKSA